METPTITTAQHLAAKIVEQINSLAARIPQFQPPHRSTSARARAANSVSPDFIQTMIAAVEASPELQLLGTFDTDDARDMLQFNDAFRAVADYVAIFLSSIRHTMRLRKARVVFAAMRTYAIAKGLARDPDSAKLIAHLDNLRRDLGRKAGRRRPPARTVSAFLPSPIRITLAENPEAARKRRHRSRRRRTNQSATMRRRRPVKSRRPREHSSRR
jgi:hypothetical protein